MNIILLTHTLELNKTTNTGSIAVKHASHIVDRIVWQRTNPNSKLVKLIEDKKALLLYPAKGTTDPLTENFEIDEREIGERETENHKIEDFEHVVIIDGTWQQSRKIFNKSPYLKKMPTATLNAPQPSKYKLRRNQTQGGLCTIECVIEVLKLSGEITLASNLDFEFAKFNNANY